MTSLIPKSVNVTLSIERIGKTFFGQKRLFGKSLPVHAVREASLSIRKGQTLGLIGESGSGKSTLARCIMRLTEPTEGQIIFEGKDISSIPQREFRLYRKRMQIVFQDSGSTFNPRFTIRHMLTEIIRFHAPNNEPVHDRSMIDILANVGLTPDCADHYPHELSGGQRQRLGVARALAVQPSLLVCDEPVSSLDISVQAQLLNLFKDLQEQRELTYLFIAHELPGIRYMADHIAVMYRGYIVERTSKDEWFRRPLHPYSQALTALAVQNVMTAVPRPSLAVSAGAQTFFSGCVYYERCPIRIHKCMERMPDEIEILPGHFIRCHVIAGA
jgi:oligopeptide/dipeptide ABC transporter ATP-binding protein